MEGLDENGDQTSPGDAAPRREKFWRDISELFIDALWEIDQDGSLRIDALNELHFDLSLIAGKALSYLIVQEPDCTEHAKRHRENTENIRHAVQGRWSFRNLEFQVAGWAGETRTLLVSGMPAFDEDGTYTGYSGAIADITERKLAEETARQNKIMAETGRQLQAVIAAAPICILLCRDEPPRIVLNNSAACDLFEASDAILRDTSLFGLLCDERDRRHVADRLAADGALDQFDALCRLPSGATRWGSFSIRRIESVGGVAFLVGIVDITRRKQSEAELIRAKEAAEEANRTKSAFLAMMSHEIRTPMTGIIGMADFMSKSRIDDDQRTYVDVIRSSARTLLTVLNDLLDYSKIEANRLSLDIIAFDAVSLMAETARLFWPKAEENACALTVDAGGLESLLVKGDPTRLKQVLGNLIGNAVKFTRKGQVVVRLRCDAGARIRLRFDVEDSGIGIAEAELGNLFLPFSQAGKGTTRKYGGTGLGLSISKKLVEMMGGDITATSRLGRGSVFSFTCLVEPATRGDLVIALSETVAVPPMAILLAEDNQVNRMVVKLGLEMRGHRITMVENGAQALKAAASQPFDLILMDMQMPEMDGTEATRRIRALPGPVAGVPIVALTADAIAEHRAAYMAAGLTDFLTKPIEWGQLDGLLARIQLARPGAATPPPPLHPPEPPERDAPGRLDLPGIDTADGLARMSGNVAAYYRLLVTVSEDQRGAIAEIARAVQHGDIPLAGRLAHTLKGVAGTIGATALLRTVRDLEAGLGHGDSRVLDELMTTAESELQRVITAIDACGHSQPRPCAVAVPPADLLARLERLRTMLEQYDCEAEDLLSEIRRDITDPELTAALNGLSERVGHFDFAGAVTKIDPLIQGLS